MGDLDQTMKPIRALNRLETSTVQYKKKGFQCEISRSWLTKWQKKDFANPSQRVATLEKNTYVHVFMIKIYAYSYQPALFFANPLGS